MAYGVTSMTQLRFGKIEQVQSTLLYLLLLSLWLLLLGGLNSTHNGVN